MYTTFGSQGINVLDCLGNREYFSLSPRHLQYWNGIVFLQLRRGLLQFPADPPCITSVLHYTAALGSWDPCSSTPDQAVGKVGILKTLLTTLDSPRRWRCWLWWPAPDAGTTPCSVSPQPPSDQWPAYPPAAAAGGATMQHPELQTLLRSTQTSPFVLTTIFCLLILCMSCLVCLVPVLIVFWWKLSCLCNVQSLRNELFCSTNLVSAQLVSRHRVPHSWHRIYKVNQLQRTIVVLP